MSTNAFSLLDCNVSEAISVIAKKETTSMASKTSKASKVSKTSMQSIISVLQSMYSLVMFVFSGATNNEFVIGETKISPKMKLKKNATVQDLNARINAMGLPYDCLVWDTTIDTPELKKMIDNQYSLPAEYQHLHDLMCDDTIKSMKRQKVLILDFRLPYLKGKQYAYLKNHQKLFFGSVRESYLIRKSEVHGFKKFYDNSCRGFNFAELDKVILECHKLVLTGADNEWIRFRENQIRQFKDAASVFEKSDAEVFKRFLSFEDLKKEVEMVRLFKDEIFEMVPKMKMEYDRKMLAMDVHNHKDEAFPSL